jgi:hypothetical protein
LGFFIQNIISGQAVKNNANFPPILVSYKVIYVMEDLKSITLIDDANFKHFHHQIKMHLAHKDVNEKQCTIWVGYLVFGVEIHRQIMRSAKMKNARKNAIKPFHCQ